MAANDAQPLSVAEQTKGRAPSIKQTVARAIWTPPTVPPPGRPSEFPFCSRRGPTVWRPPTRAETT